MLKHFVALQAVVLAFLLGLLPQNDASAQTVSGSSPTFTVNTLAGGAPVLSIVASTNLVAGQSLQSVSSLKSSAGNVLVTTASVPGWQTADFRALLSYGGGPPLDVTDSATWGFETAPPSGSSILRGKFAFPDSGNQTLVTLFASIGDLQGRYYTATPFVIRPFLSVTIANPTVDWIDGCTYRLNLNATAHGSAQSPPAGPVLFTWDLDNDTAYDDGNDASITVMTNSLGGNLWVSVRAVQDGVEAFGHSFVTINKPRAVTEPEYPGLRCAPLSGGLKDSAGNAFVGTDARRDVGLIVITHGIWTDSGTNTWYMQMARAIEQRLQALGKPLPNVAVYDWGGDSGGLAIALAMGTDAFATPVAVGHGLALADKLQQYAPAKVNFSKPIHLIGHSAGGMIMGECALLLKKAGFVVDRVTMLDTPAFCPNHLKPSTSRTSFPNPGMAERILSSVVGRDAGAFYEWVTPDQQFYRVKQVEPVYTYSVTPPTMPISTPALADKPAFWSIIEQHSYVHDPWYNGSIQGIQGYEDGFQHSPFIDSASVVSKVLPVSMPQYQAAAAPATLGASIDVPLTNFTFFGSVSATAGVYTCVEAVNAGLIAQVTLPPDVDELRFAYRFSGTNDGDFLTVRLGTGPDLFYGLDLSLSRTNFLDAAVDLRAYATLSTQIVFTLVSRGDPGCVVELKDIRLVTNDDVDGDGLTTAQELANGCNPQLWDTDGDGLSDGDEVNVYHTNPTRADTDGDGMSDAEEVAAGTDPNDKASCLRFDAIGRSGVGDIVLRWAARTGQTYKVVSATDVEFKSYSIEASGLTGTTTQISFTNTSPHGVSDDRGFYRVKTQ